MLKEEIEYTKLMNIKPINMVWNSASSKLIIEDTIKYLLEDYNTKDQSLNTFISYIYEDDKQKILSMFCNDLKDIYKNNNKIHVLYRIKDNDKVIKMILNGIILKNNGDYYLVCSSYPYLTIKNLFLKEEENKLSQFNVTESKKSIYAYKFDTVTGLCNEYHFKEMVSKFLINVKDKSQRAAFVVVDLDDFKYVNDSFGHDFGDLLLKEVAKIIMTVIPKNAIACRYSGDTFLIFLPQAKNKKEILSTTRYLYNELDKPNVVNGNVIYLTTSMGAAIYPDQGTDYLTLLKNADAAMYEAKRNSTRECQFFNESFRDKVNRIYNIQKELRTALTNKEIYVVFQPKVAFEDSRVNGFEALVRWNNKKFGNISPAEFIPLAESSKMILKIGSFVIEEVFRKVKFLLVKGKRNFKIAVNLSEMQLREDVVLVQLKTLLNKYKISPSYIEVEITETMLMKSFEKNIKILDEIKRLGISIALDDFGTGYSSLNYLTKLPIDVLKIDRSFVVDLMDDPKSRCIVENIINLSHQLGIEVVAEGIEEKSQVEYLKEIFCDIGQGYYYSKPRSFEEIVNLIGKRI